MATYTKQNIDVLEQLTPIVKTLKKGALLTTKSGDEVNTMTISWGKIGIEWNKVIFAVYVRGSRHTHTLLEKSGEFTINLAPKGGVADAIAFCGKTSGRDQNKIEALGLTSVEPNQICAPALAEFPLTLECKVIYKQLQDADAIPCALLNQFYPQKPETSDAGKRNLHTMFYGEIVDAYILEKL